ncbi:alpha/beta hydrolase [Flavobacterium sp. NKUCC04_CG]|uniref:alpha/beta hydrolase n=1 Tax=Flavobacterium sp. NKUCC04_CG TaxID=2842121 RepID=UPI001C5AD57F|nr:alpha/beta hydrolase [Flavobacterium sp. NKUCC04_CG]MBW3519788.1 alpha/beta hydrolase [Flavobacterium sp. NKUCC04_CG]
MKTFFKKITDITVSKSVGFFLNLLYFFSAQKSTNIAYSLFSTPQSGQLSSATLPDFLKKAKLDRLVFKKHQIQTYRWKGSGPTILLVHGWQSNSSRWQQLIEFLKLSNFNLITLDAPAQGLSNGTEFSPPIYASFIDVAIRKYRPKILISHSLGSFTSLYQLTQKHYPDLEKNIILACPNAFKSIVMNYQNLMSFSQQNYQNLVRLMENQIHMPLEEYNSERFIQKIGLPTLIIHDKSDETIPFSEALSILNASSSASLLATENLGHSLQHRQVYQGILNFITSKTLAVDKD